MKQIPYRLAEALETLCTRKSLEHITVSQIAAEAGVTRQVFYRYFDDKFELASWIHYAHLYESVKYAFEEDGQSVWRLTTIQWMRHMVENKAFYMNVFQSVSQKEFQRMIRNFFFDCYRWQMSQRMNRELTEEETFVLQTYLYGAMERIYEWISGGMQMTVERMVELLELSMPELIAQWILTGGEVPYAEAIKKMEEYIAKEGLLQTISENFRL